MFEVKVTILTPDLSAAIIRLADAISARPAVAEGHETDSCTILPETPSEAVLERQETLVANPVPAAPPVPPVEPSIPAPTAAPVQAPFEPSAPAPAPASVPAVPPAAPAKNYTLSELSIAASALIEQGKMKELMALINSFGVVSLNVLPPEHFPAFAEGIKKLGAKL